MQVKYAYLDKQFSNFDDYIEDLRNFVASGEFTLGPYVENFEKKFAKFVGMKHAIGTNTGTGALILSLKAVGVGPGDEVITVANTFIATVGAIIAVGGKPVFVDCDDRYQMDHTKLEKAITNKTKAIIPVHWAGCSPDMKSIMEIANRNNIAVVEDACPAVGSKFDGQSAGSFGVVNAFSMHPLKPLNVWGDGGIIVTNDDEKAKFLRLYRNHGLLDRDHIEIWGINDRLQPFQALVANRVLDTVPDLVAKRTENAKLLDEGLKALSPNIKTPKRPPNNVESFQLYLLTAKNRDSLLAHLNRKGIEARVHYPIPIHLQKAAAHLGYKKGDFPVCEQQADEILTLPAHQHINSEQINYMISEIKSFYNA